MQNEPEPMRKCVDWLKTYMEYTKASHSPDSVHFWTGVFTISAALRRSVWIDQLSFAWYPNHYVLIVAPPGVASKSTSSDIGKRLLKATGNEDIHFGPASLTWQSFIDAFKEAEQYRTLPNGEIYTQSPICCYASEMGTFLDPNDQAKMNALIDFWDGRPEWSHRTRLNAEEIVTNPLLCLHGSTTPSWARANLTELMLNGGLLARFIYVYADKKRRSVPYPEDEIVLEEYKRIENDLVEDLKRIQDLFGNIPLTKEAKELGRDWYVNEHETGKSRPSFLRSERFDPYWERKQTHVHKLSIILAVARGLKVITKDVLKDAILITTSNEPSVRKVFECVGVVTSASLMQELLSIINRCPNGITALDLYKQVSQYMTRKDFEEALNSGASSRRWLIYNHPKRGVVFVSKENYAKLKEEEEKNGQKSEVPEELSGTRRAESC